MTARILVVDDNAMNRDMLSRRLEVRGYSVSTAEDGYEALEKLETSEIDLVLLDIMMPRMSGVAVLRVVRESRSRTSLPVIMATAKTASEDVVEAMQAGANDYVTKPIDFPVLLARIEAQLSMRAPAPTPADPVRLSELGEGSVIDGRYEILETIGRGGFSVVYAGRQISTGQKVAIKLLRPDEEEDDARREAHVRRIRREMEVVARLNHPHIVRLIDAGTLDEGVLFLVLEYVQGRTLRQILERSGPFEPADAKHLMLQVLDALSSAHEKGIVHLDLKPENIMVIESGYRPSAMVLDFGLAMPHGPSAGERSPLCGSPAYMSPEMIRRCPPSPSMDLYAWGLVYLECLTGTMAVRRSSISATLLAHLDAAELQLPESVLPDVAAVIARATSKSVLGRYASAGEVLTALEAVDTEATVELDGKDLSGNDTRRIGS